ncbi:uncharacterized protein LOC128197356 [Vigna angularis]|uniref:uncharacterized protein LOC128197356 n=1 Tax=Phaseolus angularis TaxID=3914 RepID=UPI0022B3C180|nr:uncharacterized protein LOC128197356 [Vigna angularis]
MVQFKKARDLLATHLTTLIHSWHHQAPSSGTDGPSPTLFFEFGHHTTFASTTRALQDFLIIDQLSHNVSSSPQWATMLDPHCLQSANSALKDMIMDWTGHNLHSQVHPFQFFVGSIYETPLRSST